jgi:CRP-like cAMP-binding protein
MLDSKIEMIRQLPIFSGLPDHLLVAILECGKKTFFQEGEALIAEGEKGDTAYIILSGKAGSPKYEHGRLEEEDLWPGTLVGELAMLVETTHNVTVTAKEKLRALAISREALRLVMETHPEIATHISDKLLLRLHGLAAELRRVDQQLQQIEEAA